MDPTSVPKFAPTLKVATTAAATVAILFLQTTVRAQVHNTEYQTEKKTVISHIFLEQL